MKASLRGSIISRSQPSSTAGPLTVQRARRLLWLKEIVTRAGAPCQKTSGAPDAALRTSIFARGAPSVAGFKNAERARFAVQRPSRQSARRLAKRSPFRKAISRELSQLFPSGTSSCVCSSQYTSIEATPSRVQSQKTTYRSGSQHVQRWLAADTAIHIARSPSGSAAANSLTAATFA